MKKLICALTMTALIMSQLILHPAQAQTSTIRLDRTRQGASLRLLGSTVWGSSSQFREQFATIFNVTLTESNLSSVLANICPRSMAKAQETLTQQHGLAIRDENGSVVIYQLHSPFTVKGGGPAYADVPSFSLTDKTLDASLTLLTLHLAGAETIEDEMVDFLVKTKGQSRSLALNDVLQLMRTITDMLINITIALGIAVIIGGALVFLIAGGSEIALAAAAAAIIYAVIGIIIALLAKLINDFVHETIVPLRNPEFRINPDGRHHFRPVGDGDPFGYIFGLPGPGQPCPAGYNNSGEPALPSTPGAIDGGTIDVIGADPCN